jgi:hypothetical protein
VKSRATALARALQYKKEYQAEEKLNNENRRKAKAQGGFYVQPKKKFYSSAESESNSLLFTNIHSKGENKFKNL